MQDAVANQVCADFGVPPNLHQGFRQHTQAMPDTVGIALSARSADLLPTVQFNAALGPPQFGRLKQVATYLNDTNGRAGAFGATPAERADFLIRYNRALRQAVTSLPLNPMLTPVNYGGGAQAFDPGRLAELITEVLDTHTHLAAGYIAYCAATPNAWLTLQQLREEVSTNGGMTTTIYMTIQFFHQHLLPFTNLRAANVMLLDRARRSAPPNAVFHGFPQWGVGNGGNVADNIRNHFLKHVLDADPLGEDLHWTGEPRRWWTELNITLTRDDAQAWLNDGGTGYAHVAALFGPGANGATTLSMTAVTDFIQQLKPPGRMSARFRNEMYAAWGNAYRDRALAAGRAMTDKQVHARPSDANAVAVSGADGDIFVVGRFEGPVLGISACYFTEDRALKLGERVRIWDLL